MRVYALILDYEPIDLSNYHHQLDSAAELLPSSRKESLAQCAQVKIASNGEDEEYRWIFLFNKVLLIFYGILAEENDSPSGERAAGIKRYS